MTPLTPHRRDPITPPAAALRRAASLGALCALGAAAGPSAAVTLYDATAGTTPQQQGWQTIALAPAAQQLAGGLWWLDTTAADTLQYGVRSDRSATPLDTQTGFTLSFRLQLASQASVSSNRAGYNLTVIGSDPQHAVEIAFWTDQVWAYDLNLADADRMVHGSTALLDTTVARDYTLVVAAQGWNLSAGGQALISGALADFSGVHPFYGLANTVYFGDDTTRASARAGLGSVSLQLSAVPEPASAALLALGLAGLAARRGGRRPTR